VRLDSNFWEARVFLGEQLWTAGHLADAQTELEAALKLRPEHSQTHLILGIIQMQIDRPAEAIRHFEEALRIDPLSQQAKQHLEQLKSRLPSNP
jgi:tetratricopeptide (TPR) repeat protein